MTCSPSSRQIVLQEVFDEASVPTDEEIHDYALKIGINIENESHLLYLAQDGLMEALPPGWKPCYDEDRKEIYYFNFRTGIAQWEHPLDEVYRNLVKKARCESFITSDQVDEDSQTSIKEDLKSFEEASLIFPSSEMNHKSKALEPLSPLGLGAFKKSPTCLGPIKKSSAKEVLQGGAHKLPLDVDEDLLTKNPDNKLNPLNKVAFDETEVRKRPNSSDIRNRRNIGPMEFRHLSKQEVIKSKHFGKSSFLTETKKISETSKVNDHHEAENRTSESTLIPRDEGYGTEFSVSSFAEKEADLKGNIGKKELTLTGGGSVFLKTNKNRWIASDPVPLTFSKEELSDGLGSLDGKKSNSEVDTVSKGILRDEKMLKFNNKKKELIGISDDLKSIVQKNGDEGCKSVRFHLEKDLKINFELPSRSPSALDEVESLDYKILKSNYLTRNLSRNEIKEKAKQIEIDFEDLEIDLSASLAEDEPNPSTVEELKMGMITELKTVKPKKLKSSQTLVQEFQEVFEQKNKTKINIPTSSPLKIEKKVTENNNVSKAHTEKTMNVSEDVIQQNELDIPSVKTKNKEDTSGEDSKSSLHNLIDLSDLEEAKERNPVVENENDMGKDGKLKNETFDSDFIELADFSLKKKFEEISSVKTRSPRDALLPKPEALSKERNFLLGDLLKIDEGKLLCENTDEKLLGKESSLSLKSQVDSFEKNDNEVFENYEKRKREKVKNMEASFNKWLSDTEKLFEDKKSDALIKMKEKFEDWKINRESEFAKMYSEKREEETHTRVKELKNEFLKKEQEEMNRLKIELEKEKTEKIFNLKIDLEKERDKEIDRMKKSFEERLDDEKTALIGKHKKELEKLEKNLHEIILEKECQKVQELEFARECEEAFKAFQAELKDRYQKQKMSLLREHELLLDNLRQEHAVAIEDLRVKFLNEEEGLRKFHTDRLEEMKMKFTSLEAKKLDISDNQKSEFRDSRIYEKVRCEKRLLEDKYKTLKEKYMRLKSDAKLTLERKHKKGGVATGSETEKSSSNKSTSIFRRNESNSSNCKKYLECDKKANLKKPFSILNDNVSTEEEENINLKNSSSPSEIRKLKKSSGVLTKNQSSDKKNVILCDSVNDGLEKEQNLSEEPKKNPVSEIKKRRQLFSRLKAASTSRINLQNRIQEKESLCLSPVENLRRQLKKLEELEDQFPVTTHTDTYMRYPFTDIPQVGSSEIEFFKHKIHLERESVRRAKESLKSQKKSFENRQRELKQKLLEGTPDARSVMDKIYQEERELTDMEVSVHRTRALLGEKIIRLRHLEQSLKRISDPCKKESFMNRDLLGRLGFRNEAKEDDRTLSDLSSHSGSSGFSSTEFNVTDTHNASSRGWIRTNVEENRRQFQNNMHESSEIIQSLENLNSEICEIWEVLKKQHQSGQPLPPPPLIYGNAAWPAFNLKAPLALRHTIITSNSNGERSVTQQLKSQVRGNANFGHVTTIVDSSLVDRTRSLRDWLKAARNSSTPSEVISPSQVTL